jgi:hypothetical protein
LVVILHGSTVGYLPSQVTPSVDQRKAEPSMATGPNGVASVA